MGLRHNLSGTTMPRLASSCLAPSPPWTGSPTHPCCCTHMKAGGSEHETRSGKHHHKGRGHRASAKARLLALLASLLDLSALHSNTQARPAQHSIGRYLAQPDLRFKNLLSSGHRRLLLVSPILCCVESIPPSSQQSDGSDTRIIICSTKRQTRQVWADGTCAQPPSNAPGPPHLHWPRIR